MLGVGYRGTEQFKIGLAARFLTKTKWLWLWPAATANQINHQARFTRPDS